MDEHYIFFTLHAENNSNATVKNDTLLFVLLLSVSVLRRSNAMAV
jgi:hypothetical protein